MGSASGRCNLRNPDTLLHPANHLLSSGTPREVELLLRDVGEEAFTHQDLGDARVLRLDVADDLIGHERGFLAERAFHMNTSTPFPPTTPCVVDDDVRGGLSRGPSTV